MDAAKICPACGKSAVPDAPQGLCPECLMKSGFDTRGPGEAGGGRSAFVPPSVAQMARLFPQLEILELLGQGGMGAVYKARQPGLDRFVALKILPPGSAKDPGFAERFNREARALARLNHPNIVAVYEYGQAVDIPYFLMEYVEGSTLRQVERAYKLTPGNSIAIVMQICEALQFAHDEGVVHRDIKPENILIDQRGRVKIADFGIAKVLDQPPQDISLTGAKDVVGTAHYMAPEQLEDPQNVDHRADIFSLGVVFYELLTGELPLGKFAPPSEKVQSDARLDGVVLHTLEKEPDRRYQQASEVKTDVETIAATPAEGVPPVPAAPPPVQAGPPRSAGASTGVSVGVVAGVLGVVGLLLLLGIAALAYAWLRNTPPTSSPVGFGDSKASSALLHEDQRLVEQWTESKFNQFNDARTFIGWSNEERAQLEQRTIDALKGPHTIDFYRAINTLGALRSTNAVPLLREIAFERIDKTLRSEVSNRRRWMAVRALGLIGDRRIVPQLIHLLYHYNLNVRWWAQISLVQLTGQNFGGDWKAWGDWWNAHGGEPPFDPETIRWGKDQPGPDQLAASLNARDRKFITLLKTHSPANPLPVEAEEAEDKQTQ